MKNLRLLIIIIFLVVAGGIYIWYSQPKLLSFVKIPQLPQLEIDNLTTDLTDKLQPVLKESQPIVSSLTTEGEKVASRAAMVLGATVGISDSASQPATLIEGTAQYARYWYCKQVVDQYEIQNQKD